MSLGNREKTINEEQSLHIVLLPLLQHSNVFFVSWVDDWSPNTGTHNLNKGGCGGKSFQNFREKKGIILNLGNDICYS